MKEDKDCKQVRSEMKKQGLRGIYRGSCGLIVCMDSYTLIHTFVSTSFLAFYTLCGAFLAVLLPNVALKVFLDALLSFFDQLGCEARRLSYMQA